MHKIIYTLIWSPNSFFTNLKLETKGLGVRLNLIYAQMRLIEANPDPSRLSFSRDAANGAPVVAGELRSMSW